MTRLVGEGRRQGLAFDPVAEDYERGRAGWPPAVLEGVVGDSVLDLAAGTGKLTRLLVTRFARVVAVEPGEGMRRVLLREVPDAEAIGGSAEAIPLADGAVDAVFVAEAFHWFEPVEATSEIARVLRPGGACVVCFNLWRSSFKPKVPPDARRLIDDVFARAGEPGGPKVASGEWKAGFGAAPFGPLVESNVDHEFVCDRKGVLSYYVSISNVARLAEDEREEFRAELGRLLPDMSYRLALTANVWRAARL